jgi:hypothetical protein
MIAKEVAEQLLKYKPELGLLKVHIRLDNTN